MNPFISKNKEHLQPTLRNAKAELIKGRGKTSQKTIHITYQPRLAGKTLEHKKYQHQKEIIMKTQPSTPKKRTRNFSFPCSETCSEPKMNNHSGATWKPCQVISKDNEQFNGHTNTSHGKYFYFKTPTTWRKARIDRFLNINTMIADFSKPL